MAKCFDGMHLRCLHRRVNAEEQTDASRDRHSQDSDVGAEGRVEGLGSQLHAVQLLAASR